MIEGPNLLKEALKEGIETEAVFVRPELTSEEAEILGGADLERKTFVLSGKLFDELKDTETSQGIISVVRKPETVIPEGSHGGNYIVLDRLQDPTSDPYSPKVVRSAAGSLFRVPICFVDGPDELIGLVHENGKRLIATALEADKAYYDCDLKEDAAIVIGNEGNGIDRELLKRADEIITIPMAGNTESLNAAVSAGILMYERIRRR